MRTQQPITIRELTLPNRLVMPPMATAKGGSRDEVTEDAIDYYALRARYGGIGLIITEHMYIHPLGKASPRQMSIASDEVLDSLKRLTDAIHGEGCRVFAQLNHAGSAAMSAVTGAAPLGPSPILHPRPGKELPEELTRDQIQALTECFVQAALRAQKAGFDGVEIHSAHGYLLNQFYSPLCNRREDEYGGSLSNRLRFHREVVRAVRSAIGTATPIAMRLGGCDYMEGGTTVADTAMAAPLLEEAGVDLLDISGGVLGYMRPGHTQPGYFGEISAAAKAQVGIPVLLTGGVKTRGEAEALLEEEKADMIGIGRAILKDPMALGRSDS